MPDTTDRYICHTPPQPRPANDHGSATVWTAALLGLLVTVTSAILLLTEAISTRHAVERSADAAALAAAEAAMTGLRSLGDPIAGHPCTAAAQAIEDLDARLVLERCDCDVLDCTVTVEGSFLGRLGPGSLLGGRLPIRATARAGPVGESGQDEGVGIPVDPVEGGQRTTRPGPSGDCPSGDAPTREPQSCPNPPRPKPSHAKLLRTNPTDLSPLLGRSQLRPTLPRPPHPHHEQPGSRQQRPRTNGPDQKNLSTGSPNRGTEKREIVRGRRSRHDPHGEQKHRRDHHQCYGYHGRPLPMVLGETMAAYGYQPANTRDPTA